jgi:hypothetical protein
MDDKAQAATGVNVRSKGEDAVMSNADILPTLPLDFFDLVLLKSAVLRHRARLRSTDQPPPQAEEDIRQLTALYQQLQDIHWRGTGGSDLLTAPALRVLDDALGEFIASMLPGGAPPAEPDEILANLYRLRQDLQPLLPPASQDPAFDPGEEI